MHARTYPGVREIVADLREFSLAKELRSAYDLFQKTQRDQKMWEDKYFLQGKEEGEARKREKWEAVRSRQYCRGIAAGTGADEEQPERGGRVW